MVVDAMDLSYSKEHLDTFVLLSGDSDFSPLVSKLKENNKYVIGVGVKNSSSNLLIDNCDEFIYYEDIWRDSQKGPEAGRASNKKTAEAFSLMIDSIQALIRENKDVLWGSMIKQTMQRKKPSFNEGYYGYATFSELLEDAERKKHHPPEEGPALGHLHRHRLLRRLPRRPGRPPLEPAISPAAPNARPQGRAFFFGSESVRPLPSGVKNGQNFNGVFTNPVGHEERRTRDDQLPRP